jgi:hypothetical protein
MGVVMRAFCKGTIQLLLFATAISASPIMVGPIGLTGSGMLTSPDDAAWGGEGFGGIGLIWHATGSNGADTVSIDTLDINIGTTPFNPPFLGEQLSFASGCIAGVDADLELCHISIDGIGGWGSFSITSGGIGVLQVYDSNNPNTRSLLAQAEIANTNIEITDIAFGTRHVWGYVADFSVVDPPPLSDVPEPGTWMVGVPLLYWLAKHYRRSQRITVHTHR